MPDLEILDKLTGLVIFDAVRIDGFLGEGKEKVVLKATKLDDGTELAVQLYQSNPMFLLNEVDFTFLPAAAMPEADLERHLDILEKLVAACARPEPGLFFWHMRALYARILVGLCRDVQEYQQPVLDTTTLILQNQEFTAYARRTLSRKEHLSWLELEAWEYYLDAEALQLVADFTARMVLGTRLDFNQPTCLLALIFCEGFFGDIPRESEAGDFFSAILDDDPPACEAEAQFARFLADVDYGAVIELAAAERDLLQQLLTSLRGLLATDALDDADLLRRQGDDFLMRYNTGRNTLLRGLPRFLRVLDAHLAV